jgi:hypothetical protein
MMHPGGWNLMQYRNSEMKVDQLVSYLNDEKINLSPVFQRGHVWTVGTRKQLIKNIVQGRPIPAIFLYKEASGSRYSYNILDGKQRLESLILFIGSRREDFKVQRWDRYFFSKGDRKDVDFRIDLPDGRQSFKDLDEAVIRDFREYAIPTIEINLTDESSLDEIINLFVDINQQGVPVNRFDIVKAMGRTNALLRSVFGLVAIEQRRGEDVYYKPIRNDFTFVLKRLQIVDNLADDNSRVDRMWERLLEIALFQRTRKHRKPVEILKSFISLREKQAKLTAVEKGKLRKLFTVLATAYRTSELKDTRLATDQTHFYVMITSLIGSDSNLNGESELLAFDESDLVRQLVSFGKIIDGISPMPKSRTLARVIRRYLDLSTKQTTDVSRREERQKLFTEAAVLLHKLGTERHSQESDTEAQPNGKQTDPDSSGV